MVAVREIKRQLIAWLMIVVWCWEFVDLAWFEALAGTA
jgi:hypothetical protein